MTKRSIPTKVPFLKGDVLAPEWVGFFKDIQKSPFVDVAYGKKWTYGTAAPTTGTWAVGDICWNTEPAASGKIGWTCVTAGTPGTWCAFGAIDA